MTWLRTNAGILSLGIAFAASVCIPTCNTVGELAKWRWEIERHLAETDRRVDRHDRFHRWLP